jgi:hypothetical protein
MGMSQPRLTIGRAAGSCAFVLAATLASPSFSQSAFTALAGAWTGNGVVELRSGTTERVRCRANYETQGNGQSVKLDLRCASDAYKFELTSTIVQSGDTLSGFWFENTHRVGGKISGQNKNGLIEARAEGDIVTALLTVKTEGGHQSFLMESPGAQVEQVSIDLHR